MTALAKPAAVVNDRSILLSETMLHKDYEASVQFKKMLGVSLKGLVTKMK
jgi:hypothetical protein